jgi:hypothetical protein
VFIALDFPVILDRQFTSIGTFVFVRRMLLCDSKYVPFCYTSFRRQLSRKANLTSALSWPSYQKEPLTPLVEPIVSVCMTFIQRVAKIRLVHHVRVPLQF